MTASHWNDDQLRRGARGLVHRDLEPANVLVHEDGSPTLVELRHQPLGQASTARSCWATGSRWSGSIDAVAIRGDGEQLGAVAQDGDVPAAWDSGITREGGVVANDAAFSGTLGAVRIELDLPPTGF